MSRRVHEFSHRRCGCLRQPNPDESEPSGTFPIPCHFAQELIRNSLVLPVRVRTGAEIVPLTRRAYPKRRTGTSLRTGKSAPCRLVRQEPEFCRLRYLPGFARYSLRAANAIHTYSNCKRVVENGDWLRADIGRNCGKTVAARSLSPFSTVVRNSPSEKGDGRRRQTRNSGKNQGVTEPVPIF